MQIRKRIAGVALAASLVGSVVAAPAALAGISTPYNAYCFTSGNSGFQNTTGRTRTFAYVWRQGTTVLGAGTIRLANNATFSAATPGTPDRFGVVTNSTTYAYVTC